MSIQTVKRLKLGILGAGAFGTSLAILYSNFCDVFLFSGFKEHANEMKSASRENAFFPGFKIPENVVIDAISNIKQYEFDYILWCFPTSPSVSIISELSSEIDPKSFIIICSKGLCSNGKLTSDEFLKLLPNAKIGVLSGPTLAIDIASLHFSAADIGFNDIKFSEKAAIDLSNKFLKLFATNDIIGMQIAGTMKNIIAIACGIVTGLDLGQNAFAALLTHGLQEMCCLGDAMKAKRETFFGLAGVGDLVLTASSNNSRNMSFGKKIAAGETAKQIFQSSHSVSEGANCVEQVIKICDIFNINLPVCRSVFEIIHNGKNPLIILDAFR